MAFRTTDRYYGLNASYSKPERLRIVNYVSPYINPNPDLKLTPCVGGLHVKSELGPPYSRLGFVPAAGSSTVVKGTPRSSSVGFGNGASNVRGRVEDSGYQGILILQGSTTFI